jgi:hypothetical protein
VIYVRQNIWKKHNENKEVRIGRKEEDRTPESVPERHKA